MRFSSTLQAFTALTEQVKEWFRFLSNPEKYQKPLLLQTIEKIKREFKTLSLDGKLAFFELLVNSGVKSLLNQCSDLEKRKIEALYQDWLQVLQNPAIKKNAREVADFRNNLERNIFESQPRDEKYIKRFIALLEKGSLLLPPSGSAIKRGVEVLYRVKRKALRKELQKFSLLSLPEKRLVLRNLGGNKKVKLMGASQDCLENIKEILATQSKEDRKLFVSSLFQSLGAPSRYHTQLLNKIDKHFHLQPSRMLTFKFGHNLRGAFENPPLLPTPVALPSTPSIRR